MSVGPFGLLMMRSLSAAATYSEAALGNTPLTRTLTSCSYSKDFPMPCKLQKPSPHPSPTCMFPLSVLSSCFLCLACHPSCFHKLCLHQLILSSHAMQSVEDSCVVLSSDWTSQNYNLNVHITTPVNVFSSYTKCIDFFLWNKIL